VSRVINCATDASITCSFESNFMCGYNHVSGSRQLSRWSAVAGPAGVNEGPTVGATTGTLSGLLCYYCAYKHMRLTYAINKLLTYFLTYVKCDVFRCISVQSSRKVNRTWLSIVFIFATVRSGLRSTYWLLGAWPNSPGVSWPNDLCIAYAAHAHA